MTRVCVGRVRRLDIINCGAARHHGTHGSEAWATLLAMGDAGKLVMERKTQIAGARASDKRV